MATILYAVFIAIALYVLNGMAFMKLAQKAGRGDIAWMAWVPVCNVIQQLLLIKKSGWWVLILLVPVVNFIFIIIWQVKLLQAWRLCTVVYFYSHSLSNFMDRLGIFRRDEVRGKGSSVRMIKRCRRLVRHLFIIMKLKWESCSVVLKGKRSRGPLLFLDPTIYLLRQIIAGSKINIIPVSAGKTYF